MLSALESILALTATFNGRIQSSQDFSRFAPTRGAGIHVAPLVDVPGEIALRSIVPF
jgi:hypothetical protein